MNKYYVHKYKDKEGDHEVHEEGCHKMPHEENRIYLGSFANCHQAVQAAKRHYSQVNGCYWCCRDCHTQ